MNIKMSKDTMDDLIAMHIKTVRDATKTQVLEVETKRLSVELRTLKDQIMEQHYFYGIHQKNLKENVVKSPNYYFDSELENYNISSDDKQGFIVRKIMEFITDRNDTPGEGTADD